MQEDVRRWVLCQELSKEEASPTSSPCWSSAVTAKAPDERKTLVLSPSEKRGSSSQHGTWQKQLSFQGSMCIFISLKTVHVPATSSPNGPGAGLESVFKVLPRNTIIVM